MIIQRLSEFYDSEVKAGNPDMPLAGFGRERTDYVIVLNKNGSINIVKDLRVDKKPVRMIVPLKVTGRTSGIKANFLHDDTSYALGFKGGSVQMEKFEAFKGLTKVIAGDSKDAGIKAVVKFLDNWTPKDTSKVMPHWEDMDGTNVTFQLKGDSQCVYMRDDVQKRWHSYTEHGGHSKGRCLITGEYTNVARLHNPVKGVAGAKSTGAFLVSFNQPCFSSFGWKKDDQGLNAPIGEETVFKYTSAANYLLAEGSSHKVILGDITILIWTDRRTSAEVNFIKGLKTELANPKGPKGKALQKAEEKKAEKKTSTFIDAITAMAGSNKSEGDLKGLVENLKKDGDARICMLGLRGNEARISVVMWYESTVAEMLDNFIKLFFVLYAHGTQNDVRFALRGLWDKDHWRFLDVMPNAHIDIVEKL